MDGWTSHWDFKALFQGSSGIIHTYRNCKCNQPDIHVFRLWEGTEREHWAEHADSTQKCPGQESNTDGFYCQEIFVTIAPACHTRASPCKYRHILFSTAIYENTTSWTPIYAYTVILVLTRLSRWSEMWAQMSAFMYLLATGFILLAPQYKQGYNVWIWQESLQSSMQSSKCDNDLRVKMKYGIYSRFQVERWWDLRASSSVTKFVRFRKRWRSQCTTM